MKQDLKIGIIGLGYVGLPLAIEFGKVAPTVGFDVNATRIEELKKAKDVTQEVSTEDFAFAKHLSFSCDLSDLDDVNFYIVAVPTPIDNNHQPDLTPLVKASETIAKVIKPGDIVVYESTVYPGATEEDCLPIIEQHSGLVYNQDFYAGYSPERINPGDKERPLPKIVKITSGSTPEVAEYVDQVYKKIITAGTYKASSIKVAEAAKVIENTQRDVSIALINELSIIFSRLGIDTSEVLDAAATKWNFTRLSPGLVGGHCIGVDPYYLLHKSVTNGYVPDIIRTSREINDGMPRHVANRLIRTLFQRDLSVKSKRILILGVTFKENCPDIRNSKIIDLVSELESNGLMVDVFDPLADQSEVAHEYGLKLMTDLAELEAQYAGVIVAVPHEEFKALGANKIRTFCVPNGVFFDMKSVFAKSESDLRL